MTTGGTPGNGADPTMQWQQPPGVAAAGPPAPAYGAPNGAPIPAPAPVPAPVAARPPVGYQPAEAGWWLATDGRWYPPESRPVPTPAPVPAAAVMAPMGMVAPVAGVYVPVVTSPPKSKVAAGLLAFFLGTIGVHRFYLGYNGVGIAMLLITVLSLGILAPIVALWALIECIVIFAGGMKDAHGRALT